MKWSQVQASGISSWENLGPEELKELVRETAWKRFEESGRICQASTSCNSTTHANNPLSSYSISLPYIPCDGWFDYHDTAMYPRFPYFAPVNAYYVMY